MINEVVWIEESLRVFSVLIFYDNSKIWDLAISGELDLAGIENLIKDKTTVCHLVIKNCVKMNFVPLA